MPTRSQSIEDLRQTVQVRAGEEEARLYKNNDGYVRFFGAPLGKRAELPLSVRSATAPEAMALGFVREHSRAFGVRSATVDFVTGRRHPTPRRTFVRLNQTYAGLPVFGAQSIVQINNPGGGVEAVMNDLMTHTDKLDCGESSLRAGITARQSEAAAIAIIAATPLLMNASDEPFSTEDLVSLHDPILTIFDPGVAGMKGDPVLAWDIEVADILTVVPEFVGTATPPRQLEERILIDAQTGSAVYRYPLLHSGCHDNTTGLYRLVYGGSGREEGDSPVYYDPPVANADDVDLAYCYLGDTFVDIYAISSNIWLGWDGNGFDENFPLVARVNYSFFYPNAQWDTISHELRFSPGWAADDVVGHEYAHALTEYNSGLIYDGFNGSPGESGGMNECMSDVFGEAVDLLNGYSMSGGADAGADMWLLGEDLDLSGYGSYTAVRNMANPPDTSTLNPGPAKYTDIGDRETYPELAEPHRMCSVGNKLCYLLAAGGTFNGFAVSPLDDTYPAISLGYTARLFLECQFLLSPCSEYKDLYYAMQQAGRNAVELAILDEEQLEDIEAACRAVEIDQVVKWVDINATGAEDGSSPIDAFTSIQDAVDDADAGDDIIVMQGVYYENVSFDGAEEGIGSFFSINPYNWDVVNDTVIDGGGNGPVITIIASSPAAIAGFTIRNGDHDIWEGTGGGIYPVEGNTSTMIAYNYFHDNVAWVGGAIGGCGGLILNNVFEGNTGGYGGGALYGCNGIILWNTFYGNAVTYSGSGGGALLSCSGGYSWIANNIFWNNTYQGSASHAYSQLSLCSTPTYCCIQNWSGGGTGNITSNPGLADPSNGDFHLSSSSSPCVDAGYVLEGFSYDMDGHLHGNDDVKDYYLYQTGNGYLGWHTGDAPDMGADEFAWLTD